MTVRRAPADHARRTLARQFPHREGRGVADLVALYDALGPFQTQVPRAAFLFAASRLPGITHRTVVEAFESYALVKGTTLRGTVHSSTPQHHAWSAAVAGVRLDPGLTKALSLHRTTPAEVREETYAFAAGAWRERDAVVDHLTHWLHEREPEGYGTVPDSHARNLLWGAPGLVRRPPDVRWHTRTDTLHRRATDLYEAVPYDMPYDRDPDLARRALVRTHLRAYGPATRRDIAWWSGDTLGAVDRAVSALGDEVVTQEQAGSDPLLDLVDAPAAEAYDGGVHLLPEFDGLLLGYAPVSRGRFINPDNLKHVFSRINGTASPMVLVEDRIVGRWRIAPRGRRIDVEVSTFPGEQPPANGALTDALGSVEAVLGVEIDEVRVRR